ncbi:hypothetical protein ONZ45_g5015 [Pleurotus djamor]|nr:hypothetical protein ONZ45_g5015 [Pleurotus djamor]
MSYFLPHLPSGWHVDEAIKSEEDRVVVIRFGHDWDTQCMVMDENLYAVAEKVQNFAVIYLVDITEVPDFNKMYELYDPCTVMFFYRNKHIMIDLGTGNNNKINWAMDNKQELIDIIETVYRGASKGRGLTIRLAIGTNGGFPNVGPPSRPGWKVTVLGAGYAIQSAAASDRYMTVESTLLLDTRVVASPYPVSWTIEPDESEADAWRIFWPNSNLCFDLEGNGSDTPGAKVIPSAPQPPFPNLTLRKLLLTECSPSQTSQLWSLNVSHTGVPADTKSPAVIVDMPSGIRTSDTTCIQIPSVDAPGDGVKVITTTVTTARIEGLGQLPVLEVRPQGSFLLMRGALERNMWIHIPISLLTLLLLIRK